MIFANGLLPIVHAQGARVILGDTWVQQHTLRLAWFWSVAILINSLNLFATVSTTNHKRAISFAMLVLNVGVSIVFGFVGLINIFQSLPHLFVTLKNLGIL